MKNIFLLSFFIAILGFFSCKKDNNQVANPVACFTVDATASTDSAHTFLFDQCPPAYDLSYWDFGDGQYSSNPNPAHVFNHYGTYNVKLTVTNSAAQSNSVTKTITITPDTTYVDFYAVAKHHGVTIPSQSFYPDTLFLKHHTTSIPSSLAGFDTFYVGIPGDTFVYFRIHQPDSMFIFMTGWDTLISMQVKGGMPYTTTADTGSIHLNVAVTE
jgi:hypothetical protein